MVDDELLPKNHPLQLYLEELDLIDEAQFENEEELKVSSWRNSFSVRFQLLVIWASSIIHPWAFDFVEQLRQRILKSSTDFINEEDHVAMRHVYSSPGRPHGVTSFFILVSLGLILPTSIIAASSSILVSAVGYLFLFSGLFILLCALCLFTINCLLRSCSNHLKLVHAPLKQCLTFLQEFDHHASFGTSHLPLLLNETVWSFPTLQKHFGLCLQFYNKVLIQLSSELNDMMRTTSDFSYGLSSSELVPLKERVCSNQLTFILRELKMLREVSDLLESDFTSKVMGLICVAPVQSVVIWVHLTFLLWNFLRSVDSIREPLSRLDRLREYLQNGGSDSDGGESVPATVENFENLRSPLQKPATRLTRTILMRLLCATKSTRHLAELAEQCDETSDSPDDWIPIFDCIRCQLDGCAATLEELQRLLLPGMIKEHSKCDGVTGQQENFTFQSLNQVTPPTTLVARDIDPEDDVLEDVAVGDDSSDEDKSKSDNDQEIYENTIVPLHSSVLKELRNALTYRRLTMQEREQKALQKRARTDRLSSVAHSVPAVTNIPSDHESLESPVVNPYEASDMGSDIVPNDDKTPPLTSSQNGDVHLDSFFSRSSSINDTVPLVPAQNHLLRRCSWEARSAVTKRTNLFRRTVARSSPLVERKTSETDPQASVIPPHITGMTRIPLPGLVSLPSLRPCVPGANPLFRLLRPDGSFASALLAQRRKLGYTEEESFIAIGTGEEELPEPPVPKNGCSTK